MSDLSDCMRHERPDAVTATRAPPPSVNACGSHCANSQSGARDSSENTHTITSTGACVKVSSESNDLVTAAARSMGPVMLRGPSCPSEMHSGACQSGGPVADFA